MHPRGLKASHDAAGKPRSDARRQFDRGEQQADHRRGKADLLHVGDIDRCLDAVAGIAHQHGDRRKSDRRDREHGDGGGVIGQSRQGVGESERFYFLLCASLVGVDRSMRRCYIRFGGDPKRTESKRRPQGAETVGQPGAAEIEQETRDDGCDRRADTRETAETTDIFGIALGDARNQCLSPRPTDGNRETAEHLKYQQSIKACHEREQGRAYNDNADKNQRDPADAKPVHERAAVDRQKKRKEGSGPDERPNFGIRHAKRDAGINRDQKHENVNQRHAENAECIDGAQLFGVGTGRDSGCHSMGLKGVTATHRATRPHKKSRPNPMIGKLSSISQ